MDQSTHSDAGTNPSLDALASLLGVKGQLRLVPQGPTPKPHIVLKRDFPKADDDLEGPPPGVARFSFIAGKKFSVSKGQPLLFAVASPTDSDGKTLLSDENTFFIEADIADGSEENHEKDEEEATYHRRRKRKRIENVEGLPPKMRKSYTKRTTYESFIEREHASSLGFLGYPLGAPTPRVYSSAAVQTENVLSTTPIPLDHMSVPRATSILGHADNSPLQLPSPVSANHALEPISEDLAPLEGEETDAFSRAERSLSPMDLSSTGGSASCSPSIQEFPLPQEQGTVPICETLSTEHALTPSTEIPQVSSTATDATVDLFSHVEPVIPPSHSESQSPKVQQISTPSHSQSPLPPSGNNVSNSWKGEKPSEVSTLPRLVSPSPLLSPAIQDSADSVNTASSETLEAISKKQEQTLELHIKKELLAEAEKALSAQNTVTSTPPLKPTPVMPRAMRATPHTGEKAKGKEPAIALSQDYLPTPISMRICGSSSLSRSASPPPDPKQLSFVASVSSSNPLGIRPSHSLQKTAPKAPRSLLSSTSTTSVPKKPLVVGTNWSAARNPGSNSAATSSTSLSNNGGSFYASPSTSSSSLTSLPSTSSPVAPSAPSPAALSSFIPYASPSPPPPPPPDSDPPPPLPPQPAAATGGSKWKRISCADDQKADAVNKAPKATQSPIAPNKMLKRPLDSLIEDSEHGQGEGPSKRVRDSPSPATTTSATTTAGSSAKSPPLMSPSAHSQSSIPSATKTQPVTSSSNAHPSSFPTTSKTQQSSGSSSSSTLQSAVSAVPQPLKHPLPPKPPAPPITGSSYRPSASGRSERTPEASSSSAEAKRPSQARTDWPSTQPISSYTLHGETSSTSVQKIMFCSSGTLFAVVCTDRTLRICENKQPPAEIARLSHNAPLISMAWIEVGSAVLVLTGEGILGIWTRAGTLWNFTKLQRITELAFMENDMIPQMVYSNGYVAVTIPSGVRVWSYRRGELRTERDISRSGVTAIQFVHDGRALVGGCKDGVLWHCDLPSGALRVQCFLSINAITSIDVHPTGQYLLISQAGGKAVLVAPKANETASVEKTYTNEKLQLSTPHRFPAVFATKGQAVVYGTVNGCALVWDRKKGVIVYGLKHPEGDSVQAAATFDGRPGLEGMMITGTKQGRLFWWPQPVAAAPSHSASNANSSNGDELQRKRQKAGS